MPLNILLRSSLLTMAMVLAGCGGSGGSTTPPASGGSGGGSTPPPTAEKFYTSFEDESEPGPEEMAPIFPNLNNFGGTGLGFI